MRRAVAWIALVVGALGQDAPVFRADLRLKEINVLASDKQGAVEDLRQEDFQVFEDGKLREIKFFVIQRRGINVMPGATGAHTVILLDWLNTELADRAFAAQKILRMLSTLQPDERVAIYVMERELRVVHDFSSDPVVLAEAVRNMKGNADAPPALGARSQTDVTIGPNPIIPTRSQMEISKLDLRMRADLTKSVLGEIQARMVGISGRKNLIWLATRFGDAWSTRTEGLAVYPVDARGLMNVTSEEAAPFKGMPQFANIMRMAAQMEQKKMQQLADEATHTGGRAYIGRNDLDTVLRTILDDGATSYTLGYTMVEAPQPGKHGIRVRVARKGVTLRYAETYTVEKPAPQRDSAKQMGDAMTRALDMTRLPIFGSATSAGEVLRLEVQIPAAGVTLQPVGETWKVSLDFGLRFLGQDGALVGTAQSSAQTVNMILSADKYREVLADGVRISAEMPRPAAATALRVLIRDTATGVIGTTTIPIRVN
jgi:VWFA-related protein